MFADNVGSALEIRMLSNPLSSHGEAIITVSSVSQLKAGVYRASTQYSSGDLFHEKQKQKTRLAVEAHRIRRIHYETVAVEVKSEGAGFMRQGGHARPCIRGK